MAPAPRLRHASLRDRPIRVPPLRISEFPAPEIKRAQPSDDDRRVIEAMMLYEDRDVMVLNKPYGLAVQGGSATTHHIDGMLGQLSGDQDGNRPLLVHRLDRDTSGVSPGGPEPQDGVGTRRSLPVTPGPQALLGAGRGCAEACCAGSDLAIPGQG